MKGQTVRFPMVGSYKRLTYQRTFHRNPDHLTYKVSDTFRTKVKDKQRLTDIKLQENAVRINALLLEDQNADKETCSVSGKIRLRSESRYVSLKIIQQKGLFSKWDRCIP